MNAAILANDCTGNVDDLAGRWTDSTLEILKASGVNGLSVPMELETWHTLKDVLQSTVSRQRSLPVPPASVDELMEHIFLQATVRVARKFEPESDTFELENRLRPLIQRQRRKAIENRPHVQRSRRTNRITFHAFHHLAGTPKGSSSI
jgi:hypothetical protein